MILQIKTDSFEKLSWPPFCAICCKEVTKKDEKIPYCDNCFSKKERLIKWKDNVFGISLVFGIIGGIAGLIGNIIEEGFQTYTIVIVVSGGLFVMGIVYAIIRLLLLPLQLIFHSKLASPGVKILKSKQPGMMGLKFSNSEYADRFQKANNFV